MLVILPVSGGFCKENWQLAIIFSVVFFILACGSL